MLGNLCFATAWRFKVPGQICNLLHGQVRLGGTQFYTAIDRLDQLLIELLIVGYMGSTFLPFSV